MMNKVKHSAKASLPSLITVCVVWAKSKTPQQRENLPDPDVIADEIVENLQAALEQLTSISEELAAE